MEAMCLRLPPKNWAKKDPGLSECECDYLSPVYNASRQQMVH